MDWILRIAVFINKFGRNMNEEELMKRLGEQGMLDSESDMLAGLG